MKNFIRNNIHRFLGSNDIEVAKRKIATETSGQYVIDRMLDATICHTSDEVILTALSCMSDAGLKLEFGVYTGHTINLIAKHVDKVFGFDSFEGLPENWHGDIKKGHFALKSLPEVAPNVHLIKGWFNETIPEFINGVVDEPSISLLHVDCDLYSSTKTIFENLGSFINSGCVIIFNEYFNYPGWQNGEYLAFQEFITDHKLNYEYICYNKNHEQVAVRLTD